MEARKEERKPNSVSSGTLKSVLFNRLKTPSTFVLLRPLKLPNATDGKKFSRAGER